MSYNNIAGTVCSLNCSWPRCNTFNPSFQHPVSHNLIALTYNMYIFILLFWYSSVLEAFYYGSPLHLQSPSKQNHSKCCVSLWTAVFSVCWLCQIIPTENNFPTIPQTRLPWTERTPKMRCRPIGLHESCSKTVINWNNFLS